MKRYLAVALLTGCATTQTAPPAPEVPGDAAVVPAPAPAPPTSEEALALVEAGRKIQQVRGEGGADEAIELYQRALSIQPGCKAALWELGWSYQVKQQWAQAVAAWDQIRSVDSAYPELARYYPIVKMRLEQSQALAALPDSADVPPPEESPRAGPTVRLRAVGDVQLGRAWPEARAKLPPDNGLPIFAQVTTLLNDADLTFGNLETVLADEGKSRKCGPRSTRCYAFRVPTAYAKTLQVSGFDVMSIANNHTGDFGEEGRDATRAALDEAGILHSGPIGDLASFEQNGLRIGLVAFSTGGGVYRVQDIETAEKVVADLERKHDIVIVSFHGGAEGSKAAHVPHGTEMFLGENRGDLRAFATRVIDAGADLVLGHGPHLLRGMQIYKSRLIAYSLGNFTSWETFNLSGALGISGILDVELATNGVALNAELLPIVIDRPGIPRTDPKRQAIDLVRKLSREDFGHAVFDAQGRYRFKAKGPTPIAFRTR